MKHVPYTVKEIVKVPVHIPAPYPVEKTVSYRICQHWSIDVSDSKIIFQCFFHPVYYSLGPLSSEFNSVPRIRPFVFHTPLTLKNTKQIFIPFNLRFMFTLIDPYQWKYTCHNPIQSRRPSTTQVIHNSIVETTLEIKLTFSTRIHSCEIYIVISFFEYLKTKCAGKKLTFRIQFHQLNESWKILISFAVNVHVPAPYPVEKKVNCKQYSYFWKKKKKWYEDKSYL